MSVIIRDINHTFLDVAVIIIIINIIIKSACGGSAAPGEECCDVFTFWCAEVGAVTLHDAAAVLDILNSLRPYIFTSLFCHEQENATFRAQLHNIDVYEAMRGDNV